MAKFRSFGQLDDPFVEDGDPAFRGLDQNTEAVLLQPGYIQEGENIRIDKGIISTRRGMRNLVQFPYENAGLGLIKFLDPDGEQEKLLIISQIGLLDLFGDDFVFFNNPYPNTDPVMGVQAFEKVLFFGQKQRPKEWTGSEENSAVDFPSTPADGAVDFVCPNVNFANYISNRLAVPYLVDSPSTVAFSDILEPNQFDNDNTYFCNKGTNDQTMAISTFAENQALILNKNSIHLINNTHSLGDNSTSYEITRQYGIAGHKAYAQNGSYTYFISNEGNIQVLVPSSDPAKGMGISISKITLDQEPLSKQINDTILSVNRLALSRSIAHYHRNHVYFCLPVNGSYYPNVIAVYDSLNSQFVSIDTFSDSSMRIRDMESLNDDLYILTNKGCYIYEGQDSTDHGYAINSKVVTRSFMMGNRGIKKFIQGTISYDCKPNVIDTGNLSVRTITSEPDQTVLSKQLTIEDPVDSVARFNIRQRGYSAKMEVTSSGAPLKIKGLHLEAITSSRTVGDFE